MRNQARRYEVSDEEWERISGHLSVETGARRGRARKDDRQMLNGILWIVRSVAACRDLPERYGPWQTVYKRFVRWQEEGIFETLLDELAIDADLQDMSMDSTVIKVHQSAAGAQKGTEKIPKTSK